MPAFNAARSIREAVESVRRQTLSSWELVIVDDGSSDDTAGIVKSLAAVDARIRLLTMDRPSGGPAAPRNLALKTVSGRFVAFLDADDIWLPEKLEVQARIMSEQGATISCTGYYAFSDDRRLGTLVPPGSISYRDLLRANSAGCLTVMLDRGSIGDIAFPDCGHEDYALWLELVRAGHQIVGIPDILAGYRVSAMSVSGRKWNNLRYFWHIYRYRERFGPVASAAFCVRYALGALRKYAV
nr:glycosyltransferase family 2 protein [Marinobacter bryozoorum]